jgi:hypothetical protein
MPRLFVATRLPPEVVDLLAALERPPLPGVRWSVPDQWLVKLRPLGPVADRVMAPLRAALQAELDGAPAAACRLGPATRRLGGQWLGAPVSGLDDLAAVVFEATERLARSPTPSRSRPTWSWPGAGSRRSWPADR